jgi:hypothetical protein
MPKDAILLDIRRRTVEMHLKRLAETMPFKPDRYDVRAIDEVVLPNLRQRANVGCTIQVKGHC